MMWVRWDSEREDRVHLHETPSPFITTLGCPARDGGGYGRWHRDPRPGLPSLAGQRGMARLVLGMALGRAPGATR